MSQASKIYHGLHFNELPIFCIKQCRFTCNVDKTAEFRMNEKVFWFTSLTPKNEYNIVLIKDSRYCLRLELFLLLI